MNRIFYFRITMLFTFTCAVLQLLGQPEAPATDQVIRLLPGEYIFLPEDGSVFSTINIQANQLKVRRLLENGDAEITVYKLVKGKDQESAILQGFAISRLLVHAQENGEVELERVKKRALKKNKEMLSLNPHGVDDSGYQVVLRYEHKNTTERPLIVRGTLKKRS